MASTTDWIGKIAGYVQLASVVEGNIVPIVVGLVKEVKVLAQGQTIEYTVALSTGMAELTEAKANFTAALKAINDERAEAVPPLPPLDIPGA